MTIHRTIEDLAVAAEAHLRAADMPVLIRVEKVPGGYQFADVSAAPMAVEEPSGYKGDDGTFYWGTNTPVTRPLVVDGYVLKLMHASEYPSAGFISGHLDDINDGAIVLGCVVVDFTDPDEEDCAPEWAWVTSL